MIELIKPLNGNGSILALTENAELAGLLSRTGKIEATSTRLSKRKKQIITTWVVLISKSDVIRIAGEFGEKIKQHNGAIL